MAWVLAAIREAIEWLLWMAVVGGMLGLLLAAWYGVI
jgi:hypothetical protein